jgi:hypothetical protein
MRLPAEREKRDFRSGIELGTFHVPVRAVAGPDG